MSNTNKNQTLKKMVSLKCSLQKNLLTSYPTSFFVNKFYILVCLHNIFFAYICLTKLCLHTNLLVPE